MAQQLAQHLPKVSEGGVQFVTHQPPSLSEAALALDLAALPQELDQPTFALVREIANGPLPAPQMATREDFVKHLRILDASLPRRARDEVSGALMVNAYARVIGERSAAELAFLTKTALEELDWFPTAHQCLRILARYQRRDIHTARKAEAQRIERRELERRKELFFTRLAAGEIALEGLPHHVIEEARKRGLVRWDRAALRFVLAGASGSEAPALSKPDVADGPDGEGSGSGEAPRARKGRRR